MRIASFVTGFLLGYLAAQAAVSLAQRESDKWLERLNGHGGDAA